MGHALVDTGADMTILPLAIAHLLEITLDDSRTIQVGSAGGGTFVALPSLQKIGFAVEKRGHRPIVWQGTAYFSDDQPAVLLGHYQCLDRLNLQFRGPERVLRVEMRWEPAHRSYLPISKSPATAGVWVLPEIPPPSARIRSPWLTPLRLNAMYGETMTLRGGLLGYCSATGRHLQREVEVTFLLPGSDCPTPASNLQCPFRIPACLPNGLVNTG